MSSCVRAMSATEKFVFDLQGFVVLRGVLSADDVAQANAAIDSHKSELKERVGTLRNSANTSFGGDGSTGRREAGTMLSWPKPDCNVFRKVLDHPRLVPYLNELCGKGYRMDHMPLLIAQYKGCEGFGLHGGRMNEEGEFLPELAYHCEAGRIYNPLLACSVVLSDHNPGDGGFVVVPGSHKANFATPPELVSGSDELADNLLVQPSTKAGDVILFSESTVHGAKPWTADHERRLVIYRCTPMGLGSDSLAGSLLRPMLTVDHILSIRIGCSMA
eukprot:TRINITY_DN14223_c0_g1_i11.p1 TRINITY_DN14223_c0_g1~~TRINITY_DN14223_c0_g1_i11.p1  ORF type:complete len:274 (-),score=39.01 TRINITY_DN14223_c0_g1_i11:500-1321(-)